MHLFYKNTKKQLIISHLLEIYLMKDIWRDWNGGGIRVVYAKYGHNFPHSGICMYNHYFLF